MAIKSNGTRICFLMIVILTACSLKAEQSLTFRKFGSESYDAGSSRTGACRFEFHGWASGMNDTTDAFLFASGNITGNFDISARCAYIGDTTNRCEAGLLIRTDTTLIAPFISITYLQNSCTVIRYRLPNDTRISTIQIAQTVYEYFRIKRTGNKFNFFYKSAQSDTWSAVSTTYKLTFPSTVMAGIVHISHATGYVTEADFDSIQGFPEDLGSGSTCTPVLFDFENGSSLTNLGFTNINYWVLDTGNFIRTNTPGLYTNRAQIQTPLFTMNLGSDTTNISWEIKFDGDTVPLLYDYNIYSNDTMTIGDRANINGRLLGTAKRFLVGNESDITSNITSGRDIFIGDRCDIHGVLTARDTVHAGSGTSIIGSIIIHASPQFPVIKTKTVVPGTSNLKVNPGDSVTIYPGSYDTLYAGSNSKIVIRPGIYNVARFVFDTDVKVYTLVDSLNKLEINVRDNLSIGDRSRFILSNVNFSKYIQIYSHQTGQNRLGTDIQIGGYFYFPRAEVVFSSRSTVINGGLYANKIRFEPDGQITTNNVQSHYDKFTTAVFPALSGDDTLFLDFNVHRSCFLDTLQDLIIRRGNSLIKSFATGMKTPVNSVLSFKLQFFSMGSVHGLKMYYDDGYGLMKYFDSIPVFCNPINSLGYTFVTGTGIENRQVNLDNILLSCTRDTCPQIVIRNHPENNQIYSGENAIFTCEIESTSVYPVFQWYRNNDPIPTSNSPVLTLYNVDTSYNGSSIYCCVSNKCHSDTSRAAILTVLNCSSPQIITQPLSDTVDVNDTIQFSVMVYGLGLKYQWQESNVPIESATDSIYTINGVRGDQNLNQYSVVIYNSCGKTVLSNAATLYVRNNVPCRIIMQPTGDTIEEKDYFITEAGISCQQGTVTWLKNGYEIFGANNPELIYGPVTLSDNGSEFSCIVSNGVTSDTSNVAALKVTPPKSGRNLLAVTGKLFDGNGVPQGCSTPVPFDFRAVLYSTKTGGTPLYTEFFKDKRAIIVHDTTFTLTLGRGVADKNNLQEIVSSHKELFIELFTSKNNYGNYELIAPRMKLTAAPYAFSSGVKVIYGNGSPDTVSAGMPPGTLYIDQDGSKSTWKLAKNGWVKLD